MKGWVAAIAVAVVTTSASLANAQVYPGMPDIIGQAVSGGSNCIGATPEVQAQMLPLVREGMRRYLEMAAVGGPQDYPSIFQMRAGRPTWVRRDQATGDERKANRHSFDTIEDPFARSFLEGHPDLPDPDLFGGFHSFLGGMRSGATATAWWAVNDADGRRIGTYFARFVSAGGEFKLNRLEIDVGPESPLDTLHRC